MRILDHNGNELHEVDYEKGYLTEEKLFIQHHEAIEAVEEEGHFEVIKEYPNGGKDVDWKIDVPAVEAVDAWDEYEDILRYTPFTEEEIAEREAQQKEAEERQKRTEELIADGVTWADLAAALSEGVNSL